MMRSSSAGSWLGAGQAGKGGAVGSFFTPSGKTGTIFSATHLSVSGGVRPRWVGTLGQHLDEGEADPVGLHLERLLVTCATMAVRSA